MSSLPAAVADRRDTWQLWVSAIVAALLAALAGAMLNGVVVVFAMMAVLAGALRPSLLVALIAGSCVLLPPYVGWLVSGSLFVNLTRGVMYGASLGLLIWVVRERESSRQVLAEALSSGWVARLGMLSLGAAWILAPAIGLALGPGNALKALNGALYQALPFWVGLAFTRRLGSRRLLQLTFALLLLYTVPFWRYELAHQSSPFAWYVPPLPVLSGRDEVIRNGMVRIKATFNHPLAFDQFLVLAIPVVGSILWARRARVAGLALVALGVVAVSLTLSRSPWGALAAAALATFILRRSRLRTRVLLATAVAMVVALFAIHEVRSGTVARDLQQLVVSRFSGQTEAGFSAVGRVFLTVASLHAMREHPIKGYGVNATATSAKLPSVDDYYLALGVEEGIPITLLTALGLLMTWIWSVRGARDPESVWIAAGVGAYLAQWLFVGLHDTAPLMFLVLGHVAGWTRHREAALHADRALLAMNPEPHGG